MAIRQVPLRRGRCAVRGSPLRRAMLLVLLAGLCIGPAAAQPIAVGVNIDNPQYLTPTDRERTLRDLGSAEVRLIRVPLAPPYEVAIDFVLRAAKAGVGVNLLVPTWDPDIFPPGTRSRRAMNIPAMFDMHPLSAAEPNRFRTFLQRHLDTIEANGVTLAGLEFGNEINWASFNGDFVLPEQGEVLGLIDLQPGGRGDHIAAGYRTYLRLLEVLREVRNTSRLNVRTPIISAGLADFGPAGGKTDLPAQAVEIGASLAYLRAHGLDGLVEAYGVHTYPDPTSTSEARRARLAATLGACQPPELGKPCWLTEWGLSIQDLSCPPNDSSRAALTREVTADLQRYVDAGLLGGLIYYHWENDRDRLGLYRCGELTPSGRLALSPRSRAQHPSFPAPQPAR